MKEALNRGVYSFLFVCQSLVTHKLESHVQLLYFYAAQLDGAQPHNEAVGGFVNTLRVEHPRLLCKTIEVIRLDEPEQIFPAYEKALTRDDGRSTIIVEYGDYYNEK